MEMEETAGGTATQMTHIFNLENVAAEAIHIQQPQQTQPASVNMPTPTTSTMASIRGRSKVWQNFTVTEDGKKVRCNLCGDSLSYSHSHSTSSMLKHLKRKHNMDLYPIGDDDSKTGIRSASDKPKKTKSKKASQQQQQQQQQQFESPPEEMAEPSIQHGPLLFTDPCVRMRWTDHSETFLRNFSSLYTDEAYTDVTLVADKQFFKAHRVILSSASEFFDEMFKMTPPGQHPIIFLKDIKAMELRILLDFIYKGEVAIPPTLIPSLVKVGGEMKVKGLSEFIWNDTMASTVFQGYQTGESRSPMSQNARAPSPVAMPMQTSTATMASKLVSPVKTIFRQTTQPAASSIASQSPTTASLQRSYSRILSNVRTTTGSLNSQTQTFASSPVAIPPLKRIRILSNKHHMDTSGTDDLASCTGTDDLTTTLDDGTGAEIRVTVVPQTSLGMPISNDLKVEHGMSEHDAHMHGQHMASHPIAVLHGSSDGEGQDIEEVVYSITEVQGGGHEVMMTDGTDGEPETIVVYGTTADHSPVDKKLS